MSIVEKFAKAYEGKKSIVQKVNNKAQSDLPDNCSWNELGEVIDGIPVTEVAGTIEITQNGNYNVGNYMYADVNIVDITIPQVSNITIDENGILNFDAPDLTDLQIYNPTISYIINVNEKQFTSSTANNIAIYFYLQEGENTISITTKAVLNDTSDIKINKLEDYSMPAKYVTILKDVQMIQAKSNTAAVTKGDVIYVLFGYISGKDICKFNPKNKTFEQVSSYKFSYGLYGHCAALVNDDIYIFGGYGGNTNSAQDGIYKFDTLTNTITALNVVLPTKTTGPKCVVVGNYIYVMGGSNKDIYKFDTTTETLITLETKMPTSSSYSKSLPIALNTDIYIFGKGYSKGLYKFDTTTETIEEISVTWPSDVKTEYQMGGILDEENFYIISTYTPSNSIYKFNLLTNEFISTGLKLDVNSSDFYQSNASIGKDIYIFGNGQNNNRTTEIRYIKL